MAHDEGTEVLFELSLPDDIWGPSRSMESHLGNGYSDERQDYLRVIVVGLEGGSDTHI
jgi:hypothetical protein